MNALTKPSRTSLEPSTLQEAMQFAQMLARSTMIPRDFAGKPENVLVAVQWGREIGLGPLQALQNIAVINGRPAVWGDAMLALVRGSGLCAYVRESIEGDGEAMVATCRAARKGEEGEIVGTFTVADAKKAGLWGKAGPWTQYPKRMLQLRARGFALRDAFPDVLRGVISAEEARDTPADTFSGPTIESKPVGQPVDIGLGDEIPALAPEYPFATRQGGRIINNAPEWITAWRRLIANCQAAGALDKLAAAREMNRGSIEAVAAFDPQAAAEVNGLLDVALDDGGAANEPEPTE